MPAFETAHSIGAQCIGVENIVYRPELDIGGLPCPSRLSCAVKSGAWAKSYVEVLLAHGRKVLLDHGRTAWRLSPGAPFARRIQGICSTTG